MPKKPKKTERGQEATDDDSENQSEEKAHIYVCTDVRFRALAHEEDGGGHKLIVAVRSVATGKYTEWHMDRSVLKGDGAEARAAVLDRGGTPATDKRGRELLNSLLANARPRAVLQSVGATGWHGARFVYPDAVYGSDGDAKPVIYTGPTDTAYRVKSTVEEWRQNVCAPLQGNTRLMHAINVAFAGVALEPCGFDSFATHFYSGSTASKASTLIAAGSVHGGGGKEGYKRTWSTTANGVEGMAAAHNGTMLALDEIGMADQRQVGDVAYLFASGAGKVA